jgi:hypothetical protein
MTKLSHFITTLTLFLLMANPVHGAGDNVDAALQGITDDPNINTPTAPIDPATAPEDAATPEAGSQDPAAADASQGQADENTTAQNEGQTDQPAQSTQEVIPHVVPNPGVRRIREVLTHLNLFKRDEEVIKFGDEDTTLSGLYLPENTGTPQGGILILHDIEEHAHWPQTVGPLREYLPDYGWNTLSLFFEDYLKRPNPSTQVVKAEEAPIENSETETQPEPEETLQAENELELGEGEDTQSDEIEDQNFADEPADSLAEVAESLDELPNLNTPDSITVPGEPELTPQEQFLKDMQMRVEDGLRQLNTLGQFNLVIIAHGLSANWAAATLNERFKQNPEVRGYALVLINAKASSYPVYDLDEQLAQLQIPMLDIVTKLNKGEKRLMINRRNAITRKQNQQYLQIQLPEIHTNLKGKVNMITRRVRGWLKTHAAGEEVDVVVKN